MATLIFKNASLTVNGVDLSTRTRQVTLNATGEEHDDTVMGTAGFRSKKMGLKDWTLNATFLQDYATANVDATLFALIGAAPFNITLYPSGASIAVNNPQFSGSAVLTDYNAVDGGIGDLMEVTASFMGAGTLTRSTS